MSPTMHKIVIHVPIVVQKAILSIGQLTKEAAEEQINHFRSFCQDLVRKISEISCNRDVLNRLPLS